MTGLVHLGVVYDGVDELVARALPEIRSVLDEGGDVRVTADRGGVRELRSALGPDAERVAFPAPWHSYSTATPDFLAQLRRELPRDRRTLLLGQYTDAAPPGWDPGYAEDAVNLVLADLPLTVLCACPRSGSAEHRTLTERSHSHLLGPEGPVANGAFRAPEAAVPASLEPWGPPATTVTLRGGEGLAELRRRAAEVAAAAGLDGEARDAAVLAAHEAVLLATAVDPDGAAGPLDDETVVEIRAHGGAVVTEVRSGTPPTGTVDWRRDLLPRFCDRFATHEGPDGRRVRVLNAR